MGTVGVPLCALVISAACTTQAEIRGGASNFLPNTHLRLSFLNSSFPHNFSALPRLCLSRFLRADLLKRPRKVVYPENLCVVALGRSRLSPLCLTLLVCAFSFQRLRFSLQGKCLRK